MLWRLLGINPTKFDVEEKHDHLEKYKIPIILSLLAVLAIMFVARLGIAPEVKHAAQAIKYMPDKVVGKVHSFPTKKGFVVKAKVNGKQLLIYSLNFPPRKSIPGNETKSFDRLRYGDIVSVSGLRPSPKWAQKQGTFATAYGAARFIKRPKGGFFSRINGLRITIKKAAEQRLQQGKLLAAMLLGSRSLVEKETIEAGNKAGLSHLFAVSGLHLMVVGAIIFLIASTILRKTRFKGKAKKVAFVLTILTILFYSALNGFRPSMLRAMIMFIAGGVASWLGLRYWTTWGLLTAAWITLMWKPNFLFAPGWQMSFGAVAALIWLTPAIKNFLETFSPFKKLRKVKLARWPYQIFVGSLAIQLALMPILVYTFEQPQVIGPISNIVGIPLGLATMSIGWFFWVPPINHVIDGFLWALQQWTLLMGNII